MIRISWYGCGVFVASCLLLGSLVAQGSDVSPRSVHFDRKSLNDAARVTSLSCDAGQVVRTFLGSDDWMKRCRVELHNLSDKVITGIVLQLVVDDSGKGTANDPLAATQIVEGQIADRALRDVNGRLRPGPSQQPLSVAPHTDVLIDLESGYQRLRRVLNVSQTGPAKPIVNVRIGIVSVYFNDDSRWHPGLGNFDVADPNTNNRYRRVSPEEFYKNVVPETR